MPAGNDLPHEGAMVLVGTVVEAHAARRERRDGALVVRLHQRLGKRVEVREVEVAVQAVHREHERLL